MNGGKVFQIMRKALTYKSKNLDDPKHDKYKENHTKGHPCQLLKAKEKGNLKRLQTL